MEFHQKHKYQNNQDSRRRRDGEEGREFMQENNSSELPKSGEIHEHLS